MRNVITDHNAPHGVLFAGYANSRIPVQYLFAFTGAKNIKVIASLANQRKNVTMADDDNDDHGTVSAMADRLGLKGEARSRYIHRHMTGLGYRAEPNYVPRDDDDDDDDDDYLPRGRRREGRRERGGRQPRGGGDDWYGG